MKSQEIFPYKNRQAVFWGIANNSSNIELYHLQQMKDAFLWCEDELLLKDCQIGKLEEECKFLITSRSNEITALKITIDEKDKEIARLKEYEWMYKQLCK